MAKIIEKTFPLIQKHIYWAWNQKNQIMSNLRKSEELIQENIFIIQHRMKEFGNFDLEILLASVQSCN